MWLYRLITTTAPLMGLYWRLSAEGAFDAFPRTGPVLIAANHSCFLDPWLVTMVNRRDISWLTTRQWYDRSWFWTKFFDAQGVLPVQAEDPQATIDLMCQHLERGKIVGIFPEGRISYDGKVHRFRPGLSRVAARTGVPVVPVGIRGSFESLPRTRRFPRPSKISIHYGEPRVFPGSPVSGPPPRAASVAFQQQVFDDIVRLSGRQAADQGEPSFVA
jgi:1-acyl-sn-glycerol-3-phosphate acyltransferase